MKEASFTLCSTGAIISKESSVFHAIDYFDDVMKYNKKLFP
jgi:hypothetical protein